MSLCKKQFKMKHLTIYVLCLFITPLYAEKGIRDQLIKEINVQSRIKTSSEKFLEAKILQKSSKIVEKFTWDEATSEWGFTGSTESNFRSDGSLETEVEYNANAELFKRTTYAVDATKLITTIVYDDYTDGQWVHSQKNEVERDDKGNNVREENYYWTNNAWSLFSGRKILTEKISNSQFQETELVFDDMTKVYIPITKKIINYENGKLAEIITQSFVNNAWFNSYAEGYDYNADGVISDILYLTWAGSQWENTELYTNITWHDFEKRQLSLFEQKTWNNNQWNSSQKVIYQYKMNGGITALSFQYINNEWVYSYRLNEDYDIHNNPKNFKVEMYEGNTWKILMETELLYTYDNQNRLVESVLKYNDGNAWYNLSKEKITYKTNTGISTQKLTLNIFPNPTTDYFQLNMKEASAGTLNIYNTQGQLIVSQHIENTNDKRIDLSEFTPGTYIVNFICGYEVLVAKLVKN